MFRTFGESLFGSRGRANAGRTEAKRSKIFLSYRRSDSGPWTRRLAVELRRHFPTDRVYRDLDSNRPAVDYVRQIEEALDESRVVVAVIGPEWLTSIGPQGQRRIDEPDDSVRLELERSLQSGIAIVPVLVGGAAMPTASQLPHSLRTLARVHAQALDPGEDWAYGFRELLATLERLGVMPPLGQSETGQPEASGRVTEAVVGVQHYRRALEAPRREEPRRQVHDAVVSAAQLLRYPLVEDDPKACVVRFTAVARTVTVEVRDHERDGWAQVTVKLTTISFRALLGVGAAWALIGLLAFPALALGTAVRVFDRHFATGFLDNVQRVLEGRPIGEDSAQLPGAAWWRKAMGATDV
jgi:hypothetical protein